MSIINNARNIIGKALLLVVLLPGFFPGNALAELIDDIILAPDANGKVVAVIKMNVMVQYLRHFPPGKGQEIEVYYNIVADGITRDQFQDYETHTSPPSDLIPGFTVTTRDQATRPKLVIKFSRPVEFSVRGGKNIRSIAIVIKPEALPDKLPLVPEIKEEPTAATSLLSKPEKLNRQATELMIKGRDALLLFDSATAIEAFNSVLRLPPNKHTQDALEWLGVANEDSGHPELSRVVYERYLKFYSKGDEALRVRKRLANLSVMQAALPAKEGSRVPPPTVPATTAAPPPATAPSMPAAKVENAAKPATTQPAPAVELAAPPALPAPLPATTPSVSPARIAEAITPSPIQVPLEAEKASASVAAPATPSEQMEEVNKQAEALMIKGRSALQQGDHGIAIEVFNKLLLLPPNKFTQDAQELIGVARERSGQNFKAKLEYEHYLKAYTSGEGVARVKERLARLSAPQPAQAAVKESPKAKEKKEFQTAKYGSFSMYYYHGASHTEIPATAGSTAPPFSLTATDQSLLLTNINATMRARNDEYDNRIVFQDSATKNFLPGRASYNRLNTLYVDVRNRVADYSGRFGRQSSMGGGVMGRFDGATVGYGILPKLQIKGVAGRLVEFTNSSKPTFYGASMDMGVFNQKWNGSLYAMNQTVDGITDRKAVGGELRYFEAGKTAFAVLDYDTLFSAINIALLQGTVNNGSGTTYNFLGDYRRTPSLSTRNALNGAMVTSVSGLLQNGWLEADIRALAKARTAQAGVVQFGVVKQVKDHWQVGGDISASKTGGLRASGTLLPDGTTGIEGYQAAAPSTGVAKTMTGQVIGSNLISQRDVTIFSLSLTRSSLIRGQSFFASNHSVLLERWALDTLLRYYWQHDSAGGKETIVSPTIRLSYQAKDQLHLESEAGVEVTNNTPLTGPSSKTTRKFFSLGVRSDF